MLRHRSSRRRGGANEEAEIEEKINAKVNEIKEVANEEQMELVNGVLEKVEGPPLPHAHVTKANLFEEIGLLDPEGKNLNPMTGLPYENLYVDDPKLGTYAQIATNVWTKLPVYQYARDVIQTFYDNQVILLSSATGSGKSLLGPGFLSSAMGSEAVVVMTTPKQITTQGAAVFAAKIADVRLGEQVGYKYKKSKMPDGKDSKTINRGGVKSRRIYATDGYVLAKLGSDPLLSDVDAVIIDEVHERGINIDILIMMLRFVVLQRPKFKLVLMSATIDPKPFEKYFAHPDIKFAYIDLPGKTHFPIEEHFLETPVNRVDAQGIIEASHEMPVGYVKKAVERVIDVMKKANANKDIEGAILIFVAGKKDALDGCLYLAQESKKHDFKAFCIELHGKSSSDEKQVATSSTLYQNKPGAPFKMRVIFATEVAESSLTFEKLLYVVDAGISKQSRYYPRLACDALEKRYIAKSNHTQRKGRVGRTEPGICYNLFTEQEYKTLFPDFAPPPILFEDITEPVLEFMSGKYVSHAEIPFKYKSKYPVLDPSKPVSLDAFLHGLLTPPAEEYVSYSLRLLYSIGALAQTKKGRLEVTPLGEGIGRFRMLPPQMGKAIIMSQDYLDGSPRERRDDLIIIGALMEATDFKIDRLFESAPKTSRMNKSEADRVMKEYRAVRKKHISRHGDLISALEAYHTLMKIARPKHEMTDEEKGEASRKASEYAKKNYLNWKKFKDARDLVKDYRRDLDQIVRKRRDHLYYEAYHASEGTFDEFIARVRAREIQFDTDKLFAMRVFLPSSAHVYPSSAKESHINNVLLSLLSGYFPNYAQSAGRGKYRNCFPEEPSVADIDRFSLVKELKGAPKHLIYGVYNDIETRKRFNVITVVSESLIKNMPEHELALFKHCLKQTTQLPPDERRGNRRGKKGDRRKKKKK